jgi:hypothetical protein
MLKILQILTPPRESPTMRVVIVLFRPFLGDEGPSKALTTSKPDHDISSSFSNANVRKLSSPRRPKTPKIGNAAAIHP